MCVHKYSQVYTRIEAIHEKSAWTCGVCMYDKFSSDSSSPTVFREQMGEHSEQHQEEKKQRRARHEAKEREGEYGEEKKIERYSVLTLEDSWTGALVREKDAAWGTASRALFCPSPQINAHIGAYIYPYMRHSTPFRVAVTPIVFQNL